MAHKDEEDSIIKQYSVWYVNLDCVHKNNYENMFMESNPIGHEQHGKRPVVVISPTQYNKQSGTPIVLCCSTSIKKSQNNFTSTIKWNEEHENTWVNHTQIRTLDKSRFYNYAGLLNDNKIINKLKDKLRKFLFQDEIPIDNLSKNFPPEINGFKLVVRKNKSRY